MNLQQIILEEYNRLLQEKKRPRNFRYGYSFGRLGEDPMDEKDGATPRYGASMNKPILAFINLVLAKGGAKNTQTGKPIRSLTDQELDRMIAYKAGSDWSNRVNRATSNMSRVPGKDSWGHKQGYYKRYSREVGVSKDQAQKMLDKFGLSDTIKGVHWGGRHNQQSPRGYNKFMSLLHRLKKDPNSEYHDEATRVLSFVNKRQGGTGARRLKPFLNKALEKAGYGKNAIQTIRGKGGFIKGTLNYSIIINDKYVLSLYTRQGKQSSRAMRPHIQQLTLDTITKNLKPTDIGTGSPERQKQDAEIEQWNQSEPERNELWRELEKQRQDAEIEQQKPEKAEPHTVFRDETELPKPPPTLDPNIFDIESPKEPEPIKEQKEEHGQTIHDKYKAINTDYSHVNRPYSVYIPRGADLKNANVSIYFHGWEKGRKSFDHQKRLNRLKKTLPANTVLVVPNLGVNPYKSRPTKDFINTIKSKLGIKNINKVNLHAHSAGGSAMSRLINKFDDETLKKVYPTYSDAIFGSSSTAKAIKRMKNLDLANNLHLITSTTFRKGHERQPDKFAKKLSQDSNIKWTRVKDSHNALAIPTVKQWRQHIVAQETPTEPIEPVEPIKPNEPIEKLQEAVGGYVPYLVKVDIALKYEREFTFYGNVLNQIRSIKGIAIAKASDIGVVNIGPNKRMVLLHLKFMPDRPLHQYLTYLQMELKKIKDKDGDRILATQIKGIPRKIDI